MKFNMVTTDNKWLQLEDETVDKYNFWDCYNTARLIPKINSLLERTGNRKFFETMFWPLVPVIQEMQSRGVGELDKALRNSMRSEIRKEIASLEKSILAGTTGNYTDKLFNSPKQLGQLLYDELKLPKPTRKKNSKQDSTDLHALNWILSHLRKKDQPNKEKLHSLFHRSRLQTVLERYLVVEGDEDNRVRPTIKIGGAETGRLAYAGGPGEAVQQWPPEIRSLIKAKDGYVFVGRDYSQIEARILAVLSRDTKSLKAFKEGRDIHVENSLSLFNLSLEQYNKLPEDKRIAFRNFSKVFLYGFTYGAKSDSIKLKLFCPCHKCVHRTQLTANLSQQEIKIAANNWERDHWEVLEWRGRLVESVYGHGSNRTWTSPFGWRRKFWEPRSLGERSVMNFPMQHIASQIVNRAMIRLSTQFRVPLTLQLHDELIAEVPQEKALETSKLMKFVMETPVPELENVVFPTSGKIGKTWADVK